MKIGNREISNETLWQIIKFVIVGSLNSGVDFFILNTLMYVTGFSSGLYFSIFKGTSFLGAVINSYLLNKFWTFKAGESGVGFHESLRFLSVSVVGLIINVTVASLVVNLIGVPSGVSTVLWANFGTLVAIFVALFWNFFGYKTLVFRK